MPGMTQDHQRVKITPIDDNETLLGWYFIMYHCKTKTVMQLKPKL